MMGRALIVVGAVAVAAFLAAGVLGFEASDRGNLRLHLLVGFVSVLLLLLSQVWILIFLVASGRAVRRTVERAGLDPALAAESRARVRRLAPWLASAVLLSVATFALGPQMGGGRAPRWLHAGLAAVALAAQLSALVLERRELGAHALRLGELARAVEV